jgi:hypothetical protein
LRRAAACGVCLLLCAGQAHAGCTKDTDCRSGRICEEGLCTESYAVAPDDDDDDEDDEDDKIERAQRIGPPMKRRSVPLMVTGIVVTAAGGMSAGLFLLAFTFGGDCSEPGCGGGEHAGMMVGGAIGAIVGLGVGIPLINYGRQWVPATRRDALVLSPWITANSGGLRLFGNF